MKNELEAMKQVWQSTQVSAVPEDKLGTLLVKKSVNMLTRLRNNLLIEAATALAVVLYLLWLFFNEPQQQARYALVQVLFLIIPTFVFYYYGWQNLRAGIRMTGSLKESLLAAIQFWSKALKIYYWGGLLLLPVLFVSARWYRLSTMATGQLGFFTGSTLMIWVKSLAAFLIVAIVLWGLVWLSYGMYLKRLKKCLEELNNQVD
ncbi:MAG: hypothetical protein JNJ57_14720 [Saprospiraceae bacterium]|nr:hypothetical protein [Saprospiraceae bacterium]